MRIAMRATAHRPMALHRLLVSVVLGLGPGMAWADAPFLQLETASVEHDDERNFEISALLSRTRAEWSRQVTLEYNHSPWLNAELELGSRRSRTGAERERELGLGLRQVLVDHHRDNWGLALKYSAEWEREYEEDERGPWRFAGPTVLAAAVLPVGDHHPVLWHANFGWSYRKLQPEHRMQRLAGVGVQVPLARTLEGFAEWGVRQRESQLAHAGLRWWIKREKVAVQVSASRSRDWGSNEWLNGVHLGVTFSDLGF